MELEIDYVGTWLVEITVEGMMEDVEFGDIAADMMFAVAVAAVDRLQTLL